MYSYFCILHIISVCHSSVAASLSMCYSCLCLHKLVCVCAYACLWSDCDVEHLPSPPSHAAVRRLLSWNLPDDIIKRWQGRQVRAPVVAAGKGYSPQCVSVSVWEQMWYIFVLIFVLTLERVAVCSDKSDKNTKQILLCSTQRNVLTAEISATANVTVSVVSSDSNWSQNLSVQFCPVVYL